MFLVGSFGVGMFFSGTSMSVLLVVVVGFHCLDWFELVAVQLVVGLWVRLFPLSHWFEHS